MARHTGAANGWIKGSLKLLLPPRYGHQQSQFAGKSSWLGWSVGPHLDYDNYNSILGYLNSSVYCAGRAKNEH